MGNQSSAALVFCLLITLSPALVSPQVVAAEIPRGNPDELGMSSERLQRLDSNLKDYIDRGQLAGQVVQVLRRGQLVYSAANGMQDVEAGIPMAESSIFRIASQTKAIVSVGIMMLQERGQLSISDRLSNFIPEWSDMQVAQRTAEGFELVPASAAITLRHLLTHTAGMSYGSGQTQALWQEAGFQGWYFAGRNEPIGESIERMGSLPLEAHPGEHWIYGYNTDILGVVIERASGKDLWTFLREEILEPLDMYDTHFYLPPEKAERLAVVYQPSEQGVEAIAAMDGMRSQGRYVDGPRISYSGGAGLLSTARDYARFLQMLLNGGELDGVRLLSPKSIELMTSNHIGDIEFRPGQGFGLGFYVVNDLGARGELGSVGEYGWGGAYHSTYWVDPVEELVVVYLTQLIPANGLDDYSQLRNGIYQAIVK